MKGPVKRKQEMEENKWEEEEKEEAKSRRLL